MDTFEDFLEHHGIVGMKWGVRRARSFGGSGSSSSVASAHRPAKEPNELPKSLAGHGVFSKKIAARKAPKELSDDAKTFHEIHSKVKEKGLSSLSNAELKKFTERLDMEKKFSKLEVEMKAKKDTRPRKLAKKVIDNMAERALSSLVGHVVDAHVDKFKTGPTVKKFLPKP